MNDKLHPKDWIVKLKQQKSIIELVYLQRYCAKEIFPRLNKYTGGVRNFFA